MSTLKFGDTHLNFRTHLIRFEFHIKFWVENGVLLQRVHKTEFNLYSSIIKSLKSNDNSLKPPVQKSFGIRWLLEARWL